MGGRGLAVQTVVAAMPLGDKAALVKGLVKHVVRVGGCVAVVGGSGRYDGICEAFQGKCVRMGRDKPVCLNPFAGDLSVWHRVFLIVLAEQMASGFAEKERAVCDWFLTVFAERVKENRRGGEPVLQDFYELLLDPPFDDEGIGRTIALRLEHYVGQGKYAGFVNGNNELVMSNNLTVFELDGLEEAEDLRSVVLLTLMYRLMEHFCNPNAGPQIKYLIVDGTWASLKDEGAVAFMEELTRGMNRFRCSIVLMTERVWDVESPVAVMVRANPDNYLLVGECPERIGVLREVFGLRERELRVL